MYKRGIWVQDLLTGDTYGSFHPRDQQQPSPASGIDLLSTSAADWSRTTAAAASSVQDVASTSGQPYMGYPWLHCLCHDAPK